jgi:hypothetical protein
MEITHINSKYKIGNERVNYSDEVFANSIGLELESLRPFAHSA